MSNKLGERGQLVQKSKIKIQTTGQNLNLILTGGWDSTEGKALL
jgi:hypothetical protein